MQIPEILLGLLIVIYFVTLPRIFSRAGEASWKGYVPFYNLLVIHLIIFRAHQELA